MGISQNVDRLGLKTLMAIKDNQYRSKDAKRDFCPFSVEARIIELKQAQAERISFDFSFVKPSQFIQESQVKPSLYLFDSKTRALNISSYRDLQNFNQFDNYFTLGILSGLFLILLLNV